MNHVFVSGKLVSDPVVRVVSGDMKVAGFSIAIKDAGKRGTTSFFDVDCWNKTAELVGKNFVKGNTISLVGKLKQDSYQDKKTNATVKKVKIVADSIINLPQADVVNEYVNNDEVEVGSGETYPF